MNLFRELLINLVKMYDFLFIRYVNCMETDSGLEARRSAVVLKQTTQDTEKQ